MKVPEKTSIRDFIARYFIEDAMPDEPVVNEDVRVISYEEEGMKFGTPHVTKEYLSLEQYGDGKEFSVEYDLKVTDFKVPPLVLQPIVENALQYGIDTHEKGSRVRIETEETPFSILIRVKDDGSGQTTITRQQKERQSVGLTNVRTRLEALCGGSLEYKSEPEGTTVIITIPGPGC